MPSESRVFIDNVPSFLVHNKEGEYKEYSDEKGTRYSARVELPRDAVDESGASLYGFSFWMTFFGGERDTISESKYGPGMTLKLLPGQEFKCTRALRDGEGNVLRDDAGQAMVETRMLKSEQLEKIFDDAAKVYNARRKEAQQEPAKPRRESVWLNNVPYHLVHFEWAHDHVSAKGNPYKSVPVSFPFDAQLPDGTSLYGCSFFVTSFGGPHDNIRDSKNASMRDIRLAADDPVHVTRPLRDEKGEFIRDEAGKVLREKFDLDPQMVKQILIDANERYNARREAEKAAQEEPSVDEMER